MKSAKTKESVGAFRGHRLARVQDLLTIDIERDRKSGQYVAYVRELNDISTFGETYEQTLDHTSDLILTYIESMLEDKESLPLTAAQIQKIRTALE